MRKRLWSISLLVVAAGGLTLTAFWAFHPPDAGDFGFEKTALPGTHAMYVISRIDPGGAAERAGLHAGDRIAVTPNTPQTRAIIISTPPDAELSFRVLSAQGHIVSLHAARVVAGVPIAQLIVQICMRSAFMLIGALLALRRRDDGASLSLATFFIFFACAIAVTIPPLSPQAMLLFFIGVEWFFIIGGVAVVHFSTLFPEPAHDAPRRWLGRLAPVVGVVVAIASVLRLTQLIFDGTLNRALLDILAFGWVYFIGATLYCLIVSTRLARGAGRQRARWIMLTFAAGFSGLAVSFISLAFNITSIFSSFAPLTIVLIPLGMGYAILRHRVMDVGFVINRAAVFGALSVFIVGNFVALEWLLAREFENLSHATSVALQLGIALLLGFSIRFIHSWIDRAIDDIFFRARHRAEAGIRRFTYEATFITESTVLKARTLETVKKYLRLSDAFLVLRLTDGTYAVVPSGRAISENDPAILSMRTWHQSIHLSDVGSELPGDLACPMTVRGQLVGALACGSKPEGETFAPDEINALEGLAAAVGVCLDALSVVALQREVARIANGLEPALALAELRRLATSGVGAAFGLIVQEPTPGDTRST